MAPLTKLHTQLYPYILAADRRYRRPASRSCARSCWTDPGDRRATAAEDEFRFGPDLLAAPVVQDAARDRRVYLPRGRWLDARGALSYDAEGDGAYHAGPARELRGGRTITARAALDVLPLYVRAGAVIPMLPADVSTLSPYAGDVVRLADRRDRLRLLAFPGPRTSAGMLSGERLTSTTARGRWTLRIDGARTRRYALEASTSGLRGGRGERAFRACAVTVGGRALSRSDWRQARSGVLTARFSARRATVVVRDC